MPLGQVRTARQASFSGIRFSILLLSTTRVIDRLVCVPSLGHPLYDNPLMYSRKTGTQILKTSLIYFWVCKAALSTRVSDRLPCYSNFHKRPIALDIVNRLVQCVYEFSGMCFWRTAFITDDVP